ncbi:MAG: chlorite dismutase family protein, partial [Alicyclobacillaceae bacterium]|nr:chlorite dismutase family protein [Alicyclobacillaceae bacterium]
MSEAVHTLEGWFALHDFRSIDWEYWKRASEDTRRILREDFEHLLTRWENVEAQNQGSTAVYTIVGQKADLVMVHLRPTLQELEAVEVSFNKSRFAATTRPAYSYVSVVELSNYTTAPG